MRINDPQVADFFLKHGYLATLRTWTYEKKLGKMISVNLGPFRKIGAKVMKVIINPGPQDLSKFVCISSFRDLGEWLERAVKLHGKKPTRLVVIAHPTKTQDPKLLQLIQEGVGHE